jgi:hypothetical protein
MNDAELDEVPLQAAVSETNGESSAVDRGAAWVPPLDSISGVRVGVLVGLTDDGRTPLVIFPGQPGSAAVAARAVIDVHGAHVGREVVLMFEDGDPAQPILLGCLGREDGSSKPVAPPGTVQVDADGERLLVTAKELLVLRCGKATITLTKAGKVLIQGTYVSSRSSGVNRVKGGSIQLN